MLSSQRIHIDDDKDNVPSASGAKPGSVAAARAASGAAAGPSGASAGGAAVGTDGVERMHASVSGIMSSAEFSSLGLTENTMKVRGEELGPSGAYAPLGHP